MNTISKFTTLVACLSIGAGTLTYASDSSILPLALNKSLQGLGKKLHVHNDTQDYSAVSIASDNGFVMCSGRAGHWTGPERRDDTVLWSGTFSIETMCKDYFKKGLPCQARVHVSTAPDTSAKECNTKPVSIVKLYQDGRAEFDPNDFEDSKHVHIHVDNSIPYEFTLKPGN